MVFSFDRSYFKYYARDVDKTVCPNTLYVACTRARDQLILIGESEEGDQLPFLRGLNSSKHLEIIGNFSKSDPARNVTISRNATVTILTKYLPESVKANAMKFIKQKQLRAPYVNIPLLGLVNVDNYTEEVFELTGHAIPAMFEAR